MSGIVEKLIRVVARAFYGDEAIVVLEGLIRERFFKDDEMGNAVNLQTRQVRKIIMELHRDHIVSAELLNDKRQGGASSMTYWYIDYKHFVDVVKYRLYKMNEYLKEQEQLEMVRQAYLCSNASCGREYTALEAQRLIVPGQYEFHCGHCGEPLLECNNNEALHAIQLLQKKFKEQMNRQEGLHDGITELLRKINEYIQQGHTLPANTPSENRAAGRGGESTKLKDDKHNGGASNASTAMNGSEQSENAQSFLVGYGATSQHIEVTIAPLDSEDEDGLLWNGHSQSSLRVASTRQVPKHAMDLPEFLQGSSITAHLHNDSHRTSGDYIASLATDPTSSLPNDPMRTSTRCRSPEEEEAEEDRQRAAYKVAYLAELARYPLRSFEGQSLESATSTTHDNHRRRRMSFNDNNTPDTSRGTHCTHEEGQGGGQEEDHTSITWEHTSLQTTALHGVRVSTKPSSPQKQHDTDTRTTTMTTMATLHHPHPPPGEDMPPVVFVTVSGRPMALSCITQRDLDRMTDEEFKACYATCHDVEVMNQQVLYS